MQIETVWNISGKLSQRQLVKSIFVCDMEVTVNSIAFASIRGF